MTPAELLAASREPNVAAFLRVIRACEGTAGDNGYRMLFGGELVTSLADHPRKLVIKSGYRSTAAGAYQFLERTWDQVARDRGIPDFTPPMQDAAAVALLIRRGALSDIRAGRLDLAVMNCAHEWASLPGSPYGQPVRTMEFVRKVYALHGGLLVDQTPDLQIAPVDLVDPLPNLHTHAPHTSAIAPNNGQSMSEIYPEPKIDAVPNLASIAKPANFTISQQPMSPFVIPALSALARVIPTIADLFKGEEPSKVAERNIDAVRAIADKVLPIVLAATGAPNAQAAVEAVQADPALATKTDDALRREYYELQRVSIKEARQFAMEYAQIQNVRTVVGRLTFLEFFTLVMVGLAALFLGWLIHLGLLEGALLGSVVTLVVIAGFVDPRKFWLGLPAPEQQSEQTK